jgi:hypothetical protein
MGGKENTDKAGRHGWQSQGARASQGWHGMIGGSVP